MEIKNIKTKHGTARYYQDADGWWIDINNGCGFVLEYGAEKESQCIESAKINLEEEYQNNNTDSK